MRALNDRGGLTPTEAQTEGLIDAIRDEGGNQMLMQGGHHPKLTKQWYLDLLSHVKNKFPRFNIHGFSPSEFIHFREVFNEPLEKYNMPPAPPRKATARSDPESAAAADG